MPSLLIQNAAVLTLTDAPDGTLRAEVLAAHDVLVVGNLISAVQPTGQADPSQFDEVVRAGGKLVMPGLINTHAHVPMVIFRGLAEDVSIDRWFNEFIWPLESNLQPDDVYWGMLLGAAEMLLGGVTTVADHYFHMDVGARAIDEIGMRGVLGWAVFGSQGQGALETTERFIREHQGTAGGRISTVVAPHAPYTCDDDFLRACANLGEKLGVPAHIHAAEMREQTDLSLQKRGQTPIQVLEQTGLLRRGTIIAHACGVLPNDIELMAEAGVGVAHAPKTYLKLGMDVTPIPALRSAGVAVGLASDGAVSNNTLDLWEALRLCAMMQKDRARNPEILPIAEALLIATRESARVLGMDDRLGAVKPGYLADLIVVDLSGLHHQPLHSIPASLVYNTMASDVQTVIIDGRVVVRDRHLRHIDPAQVVHQVNRNMQRLAQRVPGQRIQTYQP